MKSQIALLIFSVILIRSCCSAPNRVEPPIPNESLGWNLREERGIRVQGDFLLHKGEATSNDKIQVKVLDLLPGDPCAEGASYLSNPSVKLQFIQLSDHQVLCENRFYEGESSTLGTPRCGQGLSAFGLLGINVTAINLRDGWVFFELRD
jgi:hypothetical protein